VKTFKIVGNDLSDGYHTFDELYEHRNLLFINLCLGCPEHSAWKPDGDGWFILFHMTKHGQISYHIPNRHLSKVEGRIEMKNVEWDGHTGADTLERLARSAEVKP
jgi:hypothetical protein